MIGTIRNKILSFFALLFLAGIIVPVSLAQESISGQVNSYAKVTAVGVGFVDIDVNPGFSVPDTVLLIQMKGVQIDSTNSSQFGDINKYYGETGYYEFLIIDNIVGLKITFTANVMGSYDPASFVQLVDVATYEDVSVDGKLVALPWDPISGTGGVLAVIAEGRLELNADIDVSGQGFKGAVSDETLDLCYDVATSNWFDRFHYHEDTLNAGRKGEGFTSHTGDIIAGELLDARFARGKGKLGSGGGGGNGGHSGGGGGGSYGEGGKGGKESCGSPVVGGFGGIIINEFALAFQGYTPYKPVIMGGGGGASSFFGGTSSDGGNGGGIVIILADKIQGNKYRIKANGEEPSSIASGNAGAGGGGAAGAVLLSFSEYNSADSLYVEAKGGNGGSNEEAYGEGGGGSGGMVFSNLDLPGIDKVMVDPSGGDDGFTQFGTVNSDGVATDGDSTYFADTLALRLNGFLFNSIVSSVTGNPTDSICFGTLPPKILATKPIGGSGIYTYTWEKSYDNIVWLPYASTPDDSLKLDITTVEPDGAHIGADSVYFRRIVTSGALIDISKAVAIKIIPLITGNIAAYDTIICYGQTPLDLNTLNSVGGGNGSYEYKWHSSLTNSAAETWSPATGAFDEEAFDVPALDTTTYYYREVFSGRCYDTTNIVAITVLPLITGNIVWADQVICIDRDFAPLTGDVPVGGDGSYIYEWKVSTDNNVTYTAGSGTNNAQNYTPDEGDLIPNQDMFLRRFVWSGDDNVCVDSTGIVTLKMWSDITGNIIGSEQTIRALMPANVLNVTPIGGSDPGAAPTYLWEDSTRTNIWAAAQGTNTNETYQPGQPALLTDTTWFRRIVWKAECSDTSNIVVVNVHPLIDNDSIRIRYLGGLSDTIICNAQITAVLVGSQPTGGDAVTYTYTWQASSDNIIFVPADGIIDGQDYDPGVLNTTTYFRRYVVSGEADHYSDTVTITVLPDITDNTIDNSQTICYNTNANLLIGSKPAGGDETKPYRYLWEKSSDNSLWLPAPGIDTTINYDPGVDTIPRYYRRIAYSGLNNCCVNVSDAVFIGIFTLPTGVIVAVPPDTTCAGEEVSISLNLTGLAPYSITLADGNSGSLNFSASSDSYVHKSNPADPYDYIYTFATITDANGCVATAMSGTQNHKVYTVPAASVSVESGVCGLTADLSATASAGSGQWYSFEPGISASSFSDTVAPVSTVTVDEYRTYTFWWRETNWQCKDSTSFDIEFYKAPNPAVAGPDAELLPLTTTYIMQAEAVEDIQETEGTWTMIDNDVSEFISNVHSNEAEVSKLVDGEYNFVWTVINGACPAVTDQVLLGIRIFKIYSAFSPNNDNINEKFVIDGLVNGSSIIENEFVITDMSGTLVYRMKNYDNSWDGKDMNGNILPDGTYYYFLRIEGRHISLRKGYVIIKRGY